MSKTLLMVPLAVVSIAVALLISSVACADEPCGNQKGQFADLEKREADLGKIAQLRMSQPVKIEDCSDRSVDLRSAAVGFRCRTSKDAIFERVAKNGFGEAWKGPDDLIWSDLIGRFTNDGKDKNGVVVDSEATRQCAQLGGKLPSRADFERGEANGFREVLPNIKEQFFWSSTVPPYSFERAYVFYGSYGNIGYGYRVSMFNVRCLGGVH